ncbi:MAG TPA: acyl carrier protein [Polyangiales bacterium]|jgi:acyl carrier protein|nr:acyl carrier protein [Polyangiales bacterium]
MSDKLKEELRGIIVEVTEVEDIPEETPFADLGIDSMMAIEIVADVEKAYDIEIAEDELSELIHLNAVYEKVKEKLREAG